MLDYILIVAVTLGVCYLIDRFIKGKEDDEYHLTLWQVRNDLAKRTYELAENPGTTDAEWGDFFEILEFADQCSSREGVELPKLTKFALSVIAANERQRR